MRRRILVALFLVIPLFAIGVVAIRAIGLWPREVPPTRGQEIMQTGRNIPLRISEIPPNLQVIGEFRCYEVKVESSGYSVEILDGELRSQDSEAVAFDAIISVTADGEETVARQLFRLAPDEKRTSFTFYDDEDDSLFRMISQGLTACSIRFEAKLQPGN